MQNENTKAQISLVIGDPVKNSKSPKMHTAAYKALGIEKEFAFLAAEVKDADLEKVIDAARRSEIRGISVTMPHKESVIKFIDVLDDDAEEIGAVNTIINEEGELIGYNTDWIGAIRALEKKTELNNKKVAVIGAGGAARAIVYGLNKMGSKVKVFNRSLKKAQTIAKDFNIEAADLKDIDEIKNYDIIINATSVGMNEDESPVDKKLLNKNQIIFDIVYSPKETKLIKNAKEIGAAVVYGYEMLLYQGVEQFKIFTKYEAPVKEMEEALLKEI